ncbi:MAG: hypothetical protein M5R40_21080 [Anaerolineae bacterium]|nr:hypothetical protein [Anaerolineae bacterium]
MITVENVHQIKKLVTFRLAGEDFELVSSVAFSPDGTMLASGSSERVLLWDLTSGEQIHEFLDTTNWEPQLAFSPDSRFLAITNWGSIDLWDLATSELKTSFCD